MLQNGTYPSIYPYLSDGTIPIPLENISKPLGSSCFHGAQKCNITKRWIKKLRWLYVK